MLAVVHHRLNHSAALNVLASQFGELDVQLQEELAHCGVLTVRLNQAAELWIGVDQRARPSTNATSFKILVVMEPPDVQRLCTDGFDLVLTWQAVHLQSLSNARLFVPATPWLVPAEWPQFHGMAKKCGLGFLRGTKLTTEGHRLRHEIWNMREQLAETMQISTDFIAGGVSRCERNSQFMYQFVLVIENSRHSNYFTEKLLDALLAQCIPVYWGCTNLAEYFDPSGVIEVDGTPDEILRACQQLTERDYAQRADARDQNFELAKKYAGDFGRRVQRAIEDCMAVPM